MRLHSHPRLDDRSLPPVSVRMNYDIRIEEGIETRYAAVAVECSPEDF